MAYIDALTVLAGAAALDTDILYAGRPGDPDPDRQMTIAGLAIAMGVGRYQEGTWTPTISSGTIAGSVGYFVRVGNIVHVWGTAQNFSDNTSATIVQVGGLPWPAVNNAIGVQTQHPVGTVSVRRVAQESVNYGIPDTCAVSGSALRFYARRIASISSSDMWEVLHRNFVDAFARLNFSLTYQAAP